MQIVKLLFFLFLFLGIGANFQAFGADNTLLYDELKRLHQKAEGAMRSKNISEANHAYREILQLNIQAHTDIQTYADIVIRLATTEIELGNSKDAETRLKKLLQSPLPQDLHLKANVLFAKARGELNNKEESYLLLRKLHDKIPRSSWPLEDRIYYLATEQLLNENYRHLLGAAKRLYNAALFAESGALYQELLEKVENGKCPLAYEGSIKESTKAELLFCLARAHFQNGNYPSVISLLQPKIASLDQKSSYLLTKAYKELRNYPKQIEVLQELLQSPSFESAPNYDEALLDLGIAYYMSGRPSASKTYLEKLIQESNAPQATQLARTYLARIFLKEKAYSKVGALLEPVLAKISPQDPLRYELFYFQAEAAFQQGFYLEASSLFEKALPKYNKEKAEWASKAFYNQGWSYLKLAENHKGPQSSLQEYILLAERAFREAQQQNRKPKSIEVVDIELEEKIYLAQGHALLLRSVLLKSEQAHKDLEALLTRSELFTLLENQAEALLIRARASSPQTKNALFKILTETAPYNTTVASKRGLYCKGVQSYKSADELRQKNDKNAKALFREAAELLGKAYLALKPIDYEMASLALAFQAESIYYAQENNYKAKTLSLLEELISSENIFLASKKQDEVLYFHALVASELFLEDHEERTLEKACESLQKVIDEYPSSKLSEKALFALASNYLEGEIYDKAEEHFIELVSKYKESPHAPQSLLLAAEAAEHIETSEERAPAYRAQIIRDYSSSAAAPEAYFRMYSFVEYLHGDESSLKHLQEMQHLYPDSPFLIISTYLMGLDAKEERKNHDGVQIHPKLLQKALVYFTDTMTLFNHFYNEHLTAHAHFEYFVTTFYKAKLEYAQTTLSLLENQNDTSLVDTSIKILQSVVADFANPNHPLTKTLLEECAYPRIYEEAEYLLSRLYIKAGMKNEVRSLISKIQEKYKERKITKAYYLALSWYELGLLELEEKHYDLSLIALKNAELASSGNLLSTEQKLTLWIRQSECYRCLNNYDQAMLMLSYVINENASSSLRIKAMLLRADIYALQGRHELAIKQLEAVTKKGGDFATAAKEKLRVEYGFD